MTYMTYKTKGGKDYTPEFIELIDQNKCIGCGRCFKACPQSVLDLYYAEDDDECKSFMTIKNDSLCIGCKACAKACPKGCFTHKPMEI